ncbi:MAG: SMC-Scp complex subunit ScpB [Gammaproteobacteria bacterium]
MERKKLKNIIEAALLAAGRPLSLDQLQTMFEGRKLPEKAVLREVISELQSDYESTAMEIREVSSGFRVQVRAGFSVWISKLWEDRPGRYSRALLETLSLIAYRQPITRGEIEDVRGVSVSTGIMRTLQERGWIRILGHRDVPGRPAMFGTTREFLDYFGLKSLNELPPLAEIRDIDSINVELDFGDDVEVSQGEEPVFSAKVDTPDFDATDSASEDGEVVAEPAGDEKERS